MLLIFWDTKEIPSTKKMVAGKIGKIEQLLKGAVGPSHSAFPSKVIITNSAKIQNLNKIYRKIDKETDVLSFADLDMDKNFPGLEKEKTLGEIYINYDWVKKDKNPIKSISELFLHGYLHLIGYDHENDSGEMTKLEKKLNKLFI